MLCEQAGPRLVDLAEGELDAETAQALRAHVDDCDACSRDIDGVRRWREHAALWHEVAVPVGRHAGAWRPPSAPRERGPWFLQWFPVAASAAALAVALLLFFDPMRGGIDPNIAVGENDVQLLNVRFEQWRQEARERLEIEQPLLVRAVLEASEAQRQAELEALVRIIKGEIDHQALAMEESFRTVITHQLEEQQRVDDLVRHVRYAGYEPLPSQPVERRP